MSQGQFDKQKTYSLILGSLALVGMILPWAKVSFLGYSSSANGFHGEGFITLLGIGAVAAAVFMNGQNNVYDKNGRMISMGGFIGIIAGAVIAFISIMGKTGIGVGIGLIISLVAGVLGLLILMGKITPPKSIDERVDKM